ncbi:Z1 domain-containing protein [Salipiger abyssi]|uniref:Z1 domain-containing protein n=1 Tax=Salipiger abyssi TaxID=1250539 RepID=UPI00405827C6
MVQSAQVHQFADQIRKLQANYGTLEEAAAGVRTFVENMGMTFSKDMDDNLSAALEIVRKERQEVEILRRHSVIDKREEWYFGPVGKSVHWTALHEYLKTKDWEEETIVSLDEASSEVVSLLDNPSRDEFACRGLVVGYVQSGKTANMTAVITKAVDAGYNLVVVLGGVTNKLRKQTQDRLEKDVLRHRELWQLYTSKDPNGDFVQPLDGRFQVPADGNAHLVVMKKESSRLARLRDTISHTPPYVRRRLKVLVIDDECDQASVNSARIETDMTRINEEIRKILALLPSVSYVGYTATPFANVFINPYPYGDDKVPDDLYPKDFITALEKPVGYFGAREVFGSDSADEGDSERDMIRELAEGEEKRLTPKSSKDRELFNPEMTESLQAAVLWFLATCAIRRARGQEEEHMSMLVHSSPYVAQHQMMSDLIRAWVEQHSADLVAGTGAITAQMSELFENERRRTAPAGADQIPESFAVVQQHLPAVLEILQYPVENGITEDEFRLDYEKGPVTCIAVGGTVLARGLTLEGLCVSFFLRTSKQYDTLLQMGRWFGYRRGYDDLPRLWTTSDLALKFRSLAVVEEEIREDIAVYRQNNLSPLEFAVKVRSIPGMAITSASKMKHAFRTSMSFAGAHVQTIRFNHRMTDIVADNWAAAARLVDDARTAGEPVPRKQGILFEGVSKQFIRRYLASTDISDAHMTLKQSHLLRYIDEAGANLDRWNVAVIQTAKGNPSRKPLGHLGNVRTMSRTRLDSADLSFADIKALMSRDDILIDAVRDPSAEERSNWTGLKACRPDVPLLLLYLIDGQSAPQKPGSSRVPLDAVGDLAGFGIVFPGSKDRSGAYFSVELDPPANDDTEEAQDELDEIGEGQPENV